MYLAHDVLGAMFGSVGIIVVLAFAGAVVGFIMDRFIGTERYHGVAGVMEAAALTGGRLHYQKMPFKAVASALSLGAGASVGPEDPSVQIGANLGSWFGQKLHLSESHVRILVAAGAAGAIAAAFKAPIAGVFFALEVILNGVFESQSFGVVVLAAVVSAAFTQAINPAVEMGPFNYTLGSPLEMPLFIPLGIGLAMVSVLFVRAVYWQHDFWHHHIHLSRPVKTALAGALVGVVGIFLPQIMGTGRETMSEILSGEVPFVPVMLLALAGFKLLMTTISMAGGFVGGIFAPALFVGTMLGSFYGRFINGIFPGSSMGDPQTYAIAGMAAMMAGVVRSPITAIMLVFELTNDYRLILPIMLATIVCVYIAERLEPSGIYSFGLLRQGVRLTQGREIDLMQGVVVGEAMLTPAPTIPENASLLELRDTLRKYRSNSLCVIDSDGLLSGIVTLSDLQRGYAQNGDKPITVGNICTHDVITISPEDVLWTAIQIMSAKDVGRLPVVRRGTREVVGLIGRHGILRAYNIAVAHKLEDQHMAERIRLNTLTGAHVLEIYVEPNAPVTGMCISEVQWPIESTVAAIRRNGKLIIPHGSSRLKVGDLLTIVADSSVTDELNTLMHSANGSSS
ncbi:MAG TPA: chloride channel protein [Phototrophicaceae bacterium]|nr:chloride channel protein [Phototrophicaceae bacterium]